MEAASLAAAGGRVPPPASGKGTIMTDDSATAGRVTQGTFSTPLEPAPRLATAIGLRKDQLWMKWDDLTGLGGGRGERLDRDVPAGLRERCRRGAAARGRVVRIRLRP